MRSSNSEIMCRELSDLPIKLQSEIVFSDIHMVPRDGGIWLIEIIAVRLRVKKKVQNLSAMWYKEFAKNFATQGDFGHESP